MKQWTIALTLALLAPHLAAETWYVDDDAPGDPGPQSPLASNPLEDGSLARPFDAVAEAIAIAATGDEIVLLDGIYQGPGNRDLDFAGKDLVVRGQGGPLRCIINAQAKGRVFNFRSGETSAARVVGLTLANGVSDTGGALRVTGGATPTIERCVIQHNRATNGAAIHVDNGGGTLLHTMLFRNAAAGTGGAIRVEGTGDLTVTGCTLARNNAAVGGAASVGDSGLLELNSTLLWDNRAPVGEALEITGSGVALVDYCNVEGGALGVVQAGGLVWGVGNIDADPLFRSTPFSDYHIAPASPCVDAGDPLYVAGGETDTDHAARIAGAAIDIGADEVTCGAALGLDCNGNGVADECEHDCNGNGIPDDCDIAAGREVDANSDSIPDSCHPWTFVYIDDNGPGDPGPGDPTLSNPNELGLANAPFDAMQEGIDAAMPFDRIRTQSGLYKGVGNRDIDYRGKNLNIRGLGGAVNVVIDTEGLGRGFIFQSGETHIAHVKQFTVINGIADRGGALLTTNGSRPAIVECIFRDNTAQYGGGVALEGGNETLRNSVIVGNTATVAGGGVWVGNADGAFVRSCTIFDNSSANAGGGVAWGDAQSARLRGAIIWNNSAAVGDNLHVDDGTVLAVTYCNIDGGVASAAVVGGSTLNANSTNLDTDPLFRGPGDYHIRVGSPCVDASTPLYVPQPGELDIDGHPRIDGLKDIGADELVCQANIGFGGPGSSTLEICGGDLSTAAETADLLLSNAPANQFALVVAGLSNNPTLFAGGLLVPVPFLVELPLVTNGDGEIFLPGVPGGGGPITAWVQAIVASLSLPQGVDISNAVELVLP